MYAAEDAFQQLFARRQPLKPEDEPFGGKVPFAGSYLRMALPAGIQPYV